MSDFGFKVFVQFQFDFHVRVAQVVFSALYVHINNKSALFFL